VRVGGGRIGGHKKGGFKRVRLKKSRAERGSYYPRGNALRPDIHKELRSGGGVAQGDGPKRRQVPTKEPSKKRETRKINENLIVLTGKRGRPKGGTIYRNFFEEGNNRGKTEES